ncbi:MAG: site-2 protease family protein, partial [Synergistaceae bacterium]
MTARLAELLLSLPAVLWAITFHEFCHGYAAMKLGDPTAKMDG